MTGLYCSKMWKRGRIRSFTTTAKLSESACMTMVSMLGLTPNTTTNSSLKPPQTIFHRRKSSDSTISSSAAVAVGNTLPSRHFISVSTMWTFEMMFSWVYPSRLSRVTWEWIFKRRRCRSTSIDSLQRRNCNRLFTTVSTMLTLPTS